MELRLVADRDVIRIENAQHVQETCNEQELGAVIGHGRRRYRCIVPRPTRDQVQQARAKVSQEAQSFYRIRGAELEEAPAEHEAKNEKRGDGGAKQCSPPPPPEPQV